MYLKLIHHEYKYAVEQIMLVLFPGEKPVYDAAAGETQSACVLPVSGQDLGYSPNRAHLGRQNRRGHLPCGGQ